MTYTWKLTIVSIGHALVAVILALALYIWRPQEMGSLCFAVAAALIGSFLSFELWLRGKKRSAGRSGTTREVAADIAAALDGPHKLDALTSLANRAHAETIRYREHVWKVVAWSVALLLGTAFAAKEMANVNSILAFKEIYACFAVIITAAGIRDVFFDYYWFVENRNLQRNCERILAFFRTGAYQQDRPLLPEKYETENYRLWNCAGHLIQWWFVIYSVAFYAIFSIFSSDTSAGG